ncbi:NCS1 family nucleobase:cation symporter-1 [Occallatibacter riparius]|uniref:NCS1 family nucleobase:cation symporter-1 n=1 Tax=Occallatibacter riparius TaxID=1002689 RepID=A0A9J7BLP0_9BACT|nr:NCS1 family nucleobase:cation symporter-1 [Occallatibacter riparius]UWZ83672.1 NCS1 family nucleobase:cation symporter-1 [Occallatibacter riparius]
MSNVADSSLSNSDLAPVPPSQRTWTMYNYIALWFSMSMEITTYQLASSLIAKGMDWKQAVGTVLLGNLIVLIPMLLNAHAGAKYGIPFPVFIRAPFGVRGANIPAILRAVVACGWFGIQSWIGGTAIHAMLAIIAPSVAVAPMTLWLCFIGFWLLNMMVVWRGVDTIRRLQAFGAPFMFVIAAVMLIWVRAKAGSFGEMLSTPSQFHSTREFMAVFIPSLTGMVGYWATLALNIPDFTRYSKSQSAQSWGQAFGLPVAMALYAFVGIAVTSASSVLFGHAVWNPIELIGMFHQPVVAFIAMIAILIATMNINIGANVVSPSNDFSNLYPRLISFRTGGMITGLLGLAMCPWHFLSTPDAYIFGWLVGYSGLLGPVAGIMVTDYFLIRKTELDVNSLYRKDGAYYYANGINLYAIAALALGVVIALVGLFVSPLRFLYDYAWFVGFFSAGAIYWGLMRLSEAGSIATGLKHAEADPPDAR